MGEAQVGEPSCSSASRCLTAQGAVDVSQYPLFASARGTCVDLTGGALRPLPLTPLPLNAAPTGQAVPRSALTNPHGEESTRQDPSFPPWDDVRRPTYLPGRIGHPHGRMDG